MSINYLKVRNGITLKPTAMPGTPENGDIYYDSTSNTFEFYQNGTYITIPNGSAFATTSLNNLASTAVNASIIPASNGAISLGSTSLRWQDLYLNDAIVDGNGNKAVSTANKTLTDNANVVSLSWASRLLSDSSTATQLAWSTTGITISTALLPSADNSIDVGSATSRWANIRSINSVLYGSTSGSITQSASSTTTPYSLTWPASQGAANSFLINNGSGGLSFSTNLPLGGSVVKNYLAAYTASTSGGSANTGNGNFELGSTTGWSLGTIGTLTNGLPTGSPTFGSGASGNLSISTVTSGSQIGGTYSLSYVSSAATTQGNMVASDAFYIDAEDQAKVLTWKLYYTVASGTANFSGTSSNSFGVALYDVTNSAWLSSTANFGMTQSSGIGYATGTVQTGFTTTQMRIVIYNVNATSGAITLYFDDISVSPQTAPIGAPMTDWVIAGTNTITATTTNPTKGTTTTDQFKWRRVGDNIEFIIDYVQTAAGTAGSGVYLFTLPNGLVMDTTKILTNGTSTSSTIGTTLGNGLLSNAANGQTANSDFAQAFAYNSTQIVIRWNQGSTNTTNFFSSAAAPNFGNTDMSLNIQGLVPIAGWSSNVQMSNDTDTRYVIAKVQNSATVTATSTTPFIFATVAYDSHDAYNTSTGKFTVPVSGPYKIYGALTGGGAVTTNVSLYVNGTEKDVLATSYSGGGAAYLVGSYEANAGDTLEVRTGTSWTLTGNSTTALSSITFERLSGPSVIAATESVNMKYTNTAGSSISNSGDQPVPFATKVYDSHNAWDGTSIYTTPVSGKYRISSSINFASLAYSAGSHIVMSVYHNAAADSYGSDNYVQNTTTTPFGNFISTTVNCMAGDTLQIRVLNNRSGGASTLATTTGYNHIEIERVGN